MVGCLEHVYGFQDWFINHFTNIHRYCHTGAQLGQLDIRGGGVGYSLYYLSSAYCIIVCTYIYMYMSQANICKSTLNMYVNISFLNDLNYRNHTLDQENDQEKNTFFGSLPLSFVSFLFSWSRACFLSFFFSFLLDRLLGRKHVFLFSFINSRLSSHLKYFVFSYVPLVHWSCCIVEAMFKSSGGLTAHPPPYS